MTSIYQEKRFIKNITCFFVYTADLKKIRWFDKKCSYNRWWFIYWTISPLGDDTVAFVSSSGTFGVINSYRTNLGVAPSLYLSSDTMFHGMGSQQDPFTIIN